MTTNPYAPPCQDLLEDLADTASLKKRRILRLPGIAMVVLGGLFTGFCGFFLIAMLVMTKPSIWVQIGVPVACVLSVAITLVRCGICTIRGESDRKAYAGALLSIFLFLPVGLIIAIWVRVSLNKAETFAEQRPAFGDRS